ncbi:unnamed protein product [Rhizophagus irregularis]|nr:unnamed protein product [Rhizophagus irregularis]
MDNEQQPTNRTIDATQMEHVPSKIPCDNLNISCDFSDTTPSYAIEIAKSVYWQDSNISNIVGNLFTFEVNFSI